MKILLNNLEQIYDEKKILSDISFGVKEGEFITLIGPSGCGKSTVFKIITGLEKNYAGNHLAGQIIRSGTSPALNYGEAQSAESSKDFIHKMGICLKELRESNGTAACNLFKAMGLDYVYLEEGNDIPKLIDTFEKVKDIDHPIVVHIHTQKGKGYNCDLPAAQNSGAG